MREEIIINNLVEFVNIQSFECTHEIGKHSKLTISGNITEAEASKLSKISPDNNIIFSICDKKSIEYRFFNGIIVEVDLHTENQLNYLTLICSSNSLIMDKEKKFRTFQSGKETYHGVSNKIMNNNDYSIIVPQNSDTAIKSMIVQYDETDWEFLCRLASRLNTFVVTDIKNSFPCVSVGFPKKKEIVEVKYLSFQMIQSSSIGVMNRKNFFNFTNPYFVLRSREVYTLCDIIEFKSQKYIITKIKTQYEGEELIHYYTIHIPTSIKTKEFFNMSLIGASFEGIVIDIESDLVRVKLDNDEKQLKHKWFYYATPFTQPDGSGWYFMPEKGDAIRLRFPCEVENNAYVSSSVHITHGDRSDPEIKYIRTIRNQEIRFEPDKMIIRDGHGSSITLDHNDGIIIETDENITSSSAFDTRISANGKITIQSKNSTTLRNNSSIVKLEENIDISSIHTRIQ